MHIKSINRTLGDIHICWLSAPSGTMDYKLSHRRADDYNLPPLKEFAVTKQTKVSEYGAFNCLQFSTEYLMLFSSTDPLGKVWSKHDYPLRNLSLTSPTINTVGSRKGISESIQRRIRKLLRGKKVLLSSPRPPYKLLVVLFLPTGHD